MRASERDETTRAVFRSQVATLDQRRFIFVDETSTHTSMTRRYARAPRGQRAYGVVPRNHGHRVSVIGALGVQGLVAAMSVDGAVDTDVFNVFVERVLVPVLRPGDVVLLDNLSVHHASKIEHAVTAVHGAVHFLPSYSPDFSPIEPCWSKIKTCLRTVAARTRQRLETALTNALRTVQPDNCLAWFRHCGYLVSSECNSL